jgi:hypothetical protein
LHDDEGFLEEFLDCLLVCLKANQQKKFPKNTLLRVNSWGYFNICMKDWKKVFFRKSTHLFPDPEQFITITNKRNNSIHQKTL